MKIFAAKDFLTEYAKLAKKKKGPYGNIEKDIEGWFRSHYTFELIWASNYSLRDSGHCRIIKVRIINSKAGKGSSAGFRLLVLCNQKTQSVGLMYLFPKTGNAGRDNIDENQEKKYISRFLEEHKSGTAQRMEHMEQIMIEAEKKAKEE